MLPLKDNLSTRSFPVVNYALIILNIIVFAWQISASARNPMRVYQFALIPAQVSSGLSIDDFINMFSSMFMHAGLAQIGGNMLYLWIFGDNVEDAMGHGRYLFFYLLGGFLASVTHILFNPNSYLPTV